MYKKHVRFYKFTHDILKLNIPKFLICRCTCQCCQTELLEGVVEYRCCKEVTPALRILTFDGSIEHINCITQHSDFGPMTYQAVLENVGPLLRDKNGRSYKR